MISKEREYILNQIKVSPQELFLKKVVERVELGLSIYAKDLDYSIDNLDTLLSRDFNKYCIKILKEGI